MLLLWFLIAGKIGVLCILAIKWKISIFRVPCEESGKTFMKCFYFNKKKSVLLWINQPNSCTWVWSEKWMYSETWGDSPVETSCVVMLLSSAVWLVTLSQRPCLDCVCYCVLSFQISIRLLSSKGTEGPPEPHPSTSSWIPGLRWGCSKRVFLRKTDAHKRCISPEYLDCRNHLPLHFELVHSEFNG